MPTYPFMTGLNTWHELAINNTDFAYTLPEGQFQSGNETDDAEYEVEVTVRLPSAALSFLNFDGD